MIEVEASSKQPHLWHNFRRTARDPLDASKINDVWGKFETASTSRNFIQSWGFAKNHAPETLKGNFKWANEHLKWEELSDKDKILYSNLIRMIDNSKAEDASKKVWYVDVPVEGQLTEKARESRSQWKSTFSDKYDFEFVKPAKDSSGRFLNYKGDNSAQSHMLTSIYDIRKGIGRQPPEECETGIYAPEDPIFSPVEGIFSLQFMGHASMLIQYKVDEKSSPITILTDPNYDDTIPLVGPVAAYNRMTPSMKLEKIPSPNYITFSHNHSDHYGHSARNIYPLYQPTVLCGLNMGNRLANDGFNDAYAFNWGGKLVATDEKSGNEVSFHFLPGHHSSQTSATDCQKDLWGLWRMRFPLPGKASVKEEGEEEEEIDEKGKTHFNLLFLGDSAYNGDPRTKNNIAKHQEFDSTIFTQIKQSFGSEKIDILFPGIDPAYTEEEQHANHEQMISLCENLLEPEYVIPYHYGTWPYGPYGTKMRTPLDQFQESAKGHNIGTILPMAIGQHLYFMSDGTKLVPIETT